MEYDLEKILSEDLDRLEKLEKVIDILKKYIYIEEREKFYIENKYFNVLEEKEYELLKEVLSSE